MSSCVKEHCTPEHMRRMLVMMFQEGANPLALYTSFRDFLSSDIEAGDCEERHHELLRRLLSISDKHGGKLLRNFPNFPVPESLQNTTEAIQLENHVQTLQEKGNAERVQEEYYRLKGQQKAVVDEIIEVLKEKYASAISGDITKTDGAVWFIQGEAGTGKIFLLKVLENVANLCGFPCQTTALTGKASQLYERRRTLHSLLGLGLVESDATRESNSNGSRFSPRSGRAQFLRKLHLLIIDEATMMSRRLFELMNMILQDLRDQNMFNARTSCPRLLGGLNIVMAGDFRQLLPVVTNAVPASPEVELSEIPCNVKKSFNPSDLLNHLLWAAEEWKSVGVVRLTEQIRQSEDASFSSLLRAVGRGSFSKNDSPLALNSTTDIQKAYKFVFPWINSGRIEDVAVDQMLVCLLNSQVDELQKRLMELFPGSFLPPFVASCGIT